MDLIFSKILEMSLYGSIAIVVVIIFRKIFHKCPRRVLILFWLAVALRLVCPFNFSSPASLLNIGRLLPYRTEVSSEDVLTEQPAVTGPAVEIADPDGAATISNTETHNNLTSEDNETRLVSHTRTAASQTDSRSSARKISTSDVIPYIWACVALCMILFVTFRYITFFRSVNKGIKGENGIIYLDGIDSPFVIGFIKPVLCIPHKINTLEKDYIMRHERLHIKNHDGLIKLVCYLILCIHWFNPLVWAAFLMVCADLEMRVDEEVIDGLGIELKKSYCRSIVNHAVNDPAGSFMQNTAFNGIGFGGMEAKMRVKNLLNIKKVSKKLQAVAVLLSLTVAIMASACSFDFGSGAGQSGSTEETVNGIESETEPASIYEAYFVDNSFEGNNYTFSDDGLSGTFTLQTIDSYTPEYVESLTVGDTLPNGTVIESIESYPEFGDISINSREYYFKLQENGVYYMFDMIGHPCTTPLEERTYSISPDVIIIDNVDPFWNDGIDGIMTDESTEYYDMDIFMDILDNDNIFVHPDLYIRVENGEVTMIVVNPCQHQPWRDQG